MKIQAVLFDMDGTLVDTNEFHVAAWQRVFADAGDAIDADAIRAQIGKGTDMLVPALLPGSDADAVEALGAAHGRLFRDRYLPTAKPFPAAHDLLVRVRDSGRDVVFASSAGTQELDHYTALLDANGIVTATTTADDVDHTKPAPDIFAAALAKLAPLQGDATIVVGDSPFDIQAAARCGIAAVGVRSGGFDDETLRAAGAITIYDDVAALLTGFDESPLNR